jgi:hypothetical protein
LAPEATFAEATIPRNLLRDSANPGSKSHSGRETPDRAVRLDERARVDRAGRTTVLTGRKGECKDEAVASTDEGVERLSIPVPGASDQDAFFALVVDGTPELLGLAVRGRVPSGQDFLNTH